MLPTVTDTATALLGPILTRCECAEPSASDSAFLILLPLVLRYLILQTELYYLKKQRQCWVDQAQLSGRNRDATSNSNGRQHA